MEVRMSWKWILEAGLRPLLLLPACTTFVPELPCVCSRPNVKLGALGDGRPFLNCSNCDRTLNGVTPKQLEADWMQNVRAYQEHERQTGKPAPGVLRLI